jgi:transcriptional regulator with XRE-family HTH domain
MSNYGSVQIGARLRALRLAKGIKTQGLMAKMISSDTNRYNNWETGFHLLPVPFAIKICAITGSTLDYIYRGDKSGLPLGLATSIDDQQSAEKKTD